MSTFLSKIALNVDERSIFRNDCTLYWLTSTKSTTEILSVQFFIHRGLYALLGLWTLLEVAGQKLAQCQVWAICPLKRGSSQLVKSHVNIAIVNAARCKNNSSALLYSPLISAMITTWYLSNVLVYSTHCVPQRRECVHISRERRRGLFALYRQVHLEQKAMMFSDFLEHFIQVLGRLCRKTCFLLFLCQKEASPLCPGFLLLGRAKSFYLLSSSWHFRHCLRCSSASPT